LQRKIRDIVDIQIGYQCREKLDIASDGDYQLIQAKDIDESTNHRFNPSNLYKITAKGHTKKYQVKNGDVVFLSKGRRNYAVFIDGLSPDSRTMVASYFFILRIKNPVVLPKYLVWVINQPPSQRYLQKVARGSRMPFIPKDAFCNLDIEIPAKHVQELIVKLNELSQKESALLRRMEQKRSELIRGICLKAAQKV